MKTDFKVNTATEKVANRKIDVINSILEKCAMTFDQWNDNVFETGCLFIDEYVKSDRIAMALLRNEALGFWDWWLYISIQDDESLLQYPSVMSLRAYKAEKMELITYPVTYQQFQHFLKTNKRFNAPEV